MKKRKEKNETVKVESSSNLSVITFIFVILKLTGEVDYSWWWIMSPIWLFILFAIIEVVWRAFRNVQIEKQKFEELTRFLDNIQKKNIGPQFGGAVAGVADNTPIIKG